VDADGDFVVVWAGGAGGSFECNRGCSIYGQRFDRDGTPVGAEFRVPSTTTGVEEEGAAVAIDEDGDFVVVWSRYLPSSDGTSDGVFGRRFGADGTPLGAEFMISTSSDTLEQFDPSVASNAAGAFVVTWRTDESDTGDFIYAARFASDGTSQGAPIVVNTPATFTGLDAPTPVIDDAGRFIVAWFQRNGLDPYPVLFRRFDDDGTPLDAEVQADASTTDVRAGSIAMDHDGNLVVTWATTGLSTAVMFQRFDADGDAVGDPVQASTASGAARPRIAMHGGGTFALVWQQDAVAGGSDDNDIVTRLFDANGDALDDPKLISTAPNTEHSDPDIAFGQDGTLVAAWQSPDADDAGVLAQRIETPDVTPPTATIALEDSALEPGDSTTVTVTFSEEPVGFSLDDLTAENATLSSLVEVTPTSFTAMLTAGSMEDTTNVVTLAAASYEDAAGNDGAAAASGNYAIDESGGGGGGGSFDRFTLAGFLAAAGLAAWTRRRRRWA
jgi:hypothetical protein